MRLARGWTAFVLPPLALGLLTLPLAPYTRLVPGVSVALVVLAGLVAAFFRDPDRETAPGVVAPADGRVREAGPDRIVTFLNVHDVHVVRAPYDARVTAVERLEGPRKPAFLDGAEKNGGVEIRLDHGDGEARLRLLAGLVARRAVAWVDEGDRVEKGDRVGMIRFASRVDVDLPPDAVPTVAEGDRVRASASTIAARGEAP